MKYLKKKKRKGSNSKLSGNKHSKNRKIKLDEQFFIDFINNDLEILEQVFSED